MKAQVVDITRVHHLALLLHWYAVKGWDRHENIELVFRSWTVCSGLYCFC